MLHEQDETKSESLVNEIKQKIEENSTSRVIKKTEEPFKRKQNLKSLKNTIIEWSKTTDVNAYSKIFEYEKNHKAQTIWITILLALTGATFWLVAFNIQNYLSYDVSSQTSVIYETPSLFPTVKSKLKNKYSFLVNTNKSYFLKIYYNPIIILSINLELFLYLVQFNLSL